MKLWIKRSLAGVSVLAGVAVIGVSLVAGGVAIGVFGVVTGSGIFSARYWNSLCVIKAQEYADNMNTLRSKLGLSSVPPKEVRSSSGHNFVTGQTIQEGFEGNPDHPIDLISYDIPCIYPPYSIQQLPPDPKKPPTDPKKLPMQVLDEQPTPDKLPKYCFEITPTPTPMPTAQANATCPPSEVPIATPVPTATPGPAASPSTSPTPNYHYGCPTPTPIPTPVNGLTKQDLQTALEGSSGGNAPQILEAVGALKVRLTDSNGNPDLKTDPEFWGTGFVIAKNIFATTCHILEPLFEKDKDGYPVKDGAGKFSLRGDVRLYVDFTPGYKDNEHPNPDDEFPVQYLDCSHQTGLDVALLLLCPSKKNPTVPVPVTLYFDDLEHLEATPAVLVSYVDLRHPLDEITTEMYQPFVDAGDKYGSYWKFAMVDGVVAARSCHSVNLLLDLANTSVGSSGALALSIFKEFDPDPKASKTEPATVPKIIPRDTPLVAGLHKCCSAYFGEEKGYDPPPTISCAALHRTPINQDVSTVSILNDDTLVAILKSHNVKVQDNGGNCVDKFSKCK